MHAEQKEKIPYLQANNMPVKDEKLMYERWEMMYERWEMTYALYTYIIIPNDVQE